MNTIFLNSLNCKFKYTILLLSTFLMFLACDRFEEVHSEEIKNVKIVDKVNLEQFKSAVKSNPKLESFSRFFDVNRISATGSFSKNSLDISDEAIVNTDSIIVVKQKDFTSYTFSVTAPAEGNEFYNLVLYVNKNREVYKSFIVKYIPSDVWLADTSQVYSGGAQIIKNDIFDSNDVLQSKSGTTSKSNSESNDCAIVYTYYICGSGVYGHRESPRDPSCNATTFEFIYQVIDVPCTTNGGGTGGDGTDPDSGGTTTGGGSDSGVVTAPNTIPYTSQFKSFESGTLNITERSYYNSNPNIKYTIQKYLIQKYFSTESRLNAKSALAFGNNISLDFPGFNWFFSNQDSEQVFEIKSFLQENEDSPAAKSFTKMMINKIKSNPLVFTSIAPFLMEESIVYEELDPCSKGVFQTIKNTTVCDFAYLFAKLGAENSISKTTLKTAHNSVLINGELKQVTAPANTLRTTIGVKYDYTMYVNPDYNGKTKLFIAAFLLHEMAHAYFFNLADDYNMGVTNSFNELPILFNAAVINKFSINNVLHHEEIANSYVSAIASSLKEFQPGLPQQIYDDLAWGGLYETPVFDALFPEGNTNRQRIINRYNCEGTGSTVGWGTTNQQTPSGQPCN